jgi:hypothetical protein
MTLRSAALTTKQAVEVDLPSPFPPLAGALDDRDATRSSARPPGEEPTKLVR